LNLGIILTAISILIVVGPIVSAVIIYKDEPLSLITPNVEELTDKIQDYVPTVKYDSYEVIDPESSFRVKFKVTNNYDEGLTFNTINFSAYCSKHEAVLLGYGYGEDFPLTIPGHSTRILSILVTYTTEGRNDIETNHMGDTNFQAVLKNTIVEVQGIEVELEDEITVGPIEIPP